MKYRDKRSDAAPSGEAGPTVTNDRTVIYCRISLDAAREGLGVERQEAECRALAERNGWHVDDVITDNDISATTGKRRPGFEQLLSDPPARIITWHTDRLVRLTEELDRVIRLEVPVHTVTAGDLDLATPAGRAVARTITAWARYEGEQKSLRQQASHRQRVQKGKPFWSHRRPFGFTDDGQHHETEAPALRHCFAILQKGGTFAEAAAYLTGEGFTTTRGGKWHGPGLSRTMRHPRNAGLITYQSAADRRRGELPEIAGHGEWDPIVSEEEWRAILSRSEAMTPRIAAAPAGEKVKSLLGGIAECAECGDKVRRTRQQSVRRKGHPDEYRVLTYVYQPRCHHVSIPVEWLDEYVSKFVWRAMMSPATMLVDGPELAPEEAQEAAAEAVRLRERLEDVARREALDEISRDVANVQYEVLRARLAAAEAKAVAHYSASPLERLYSPAEILEAWRSDELSLQHRREAVARFIESVKIRPRAHRNERANPSMVEVEERKP